VDCLGGFEIDQMVRESLDRGATHGQVDRDSRDGRSGSRETADLLQCGLYRGEEASSWPERRFSYQRMAWSSSWVASSCARSGFFTASSDSPRLDGALRPKRRRSTPL
jgi:hypothetical protein